MALTISQLHPLYVGEVTGLDLRDPLDPNLSATIEAALNRYAVLIFRGQPVNDDQQIAFSRIFGSLETSISTIRKGRKLRLRSELADVSNLDEHNEIRSLNDSRRMMVLANRLWHTDSSFKRIPGKVSLLSAREVPPEGGETEFTDLRAAYDALPEAMKQEIEPLRAQHSIFHSRSLVGYTDFSDEERAALPPVSRNLVRIHPGSDRKTLYLASHTSHIEAWPIEQGRALLNQLMAFASQPRFVFRHCWQVGDLVIWDNRCTMHRGCPYDDMRYRRDLRRTTTEDTEFGTE